VSFDPLNGLGKAIADAIVKSAAESAKKSLKKSTTTGTSFSDSSFSAGLAQNTGQAAVQNAFSGPPPYAPSSMPPPAGPVVASYGAAQANAFSWQADPVLTAVDEQAAVEDRAYRLSLDPRNENTLEHLINPATGGSFTDADLAVAIRNGHLRHEIQHGEFGDTPFNLVQQTSSHNSYVPSLHPPITDQFGDFGLHSFELDINRGDPGYEVPVFGSENRVDGDWYVHHDSSPISAEWAHTVGGDSHNLLLSGGLEEVAGLNNVAPVTLFVDLKGNTFSAETGHTPDDLDALLEAELGDKLFTPQDWIDSVPGATTLEEALELGGWPTVQELEGRVLVVLTGGGSDGQLGEYAGGAEGAGDRAAFIAPKPEFASDTHEWVIPLEGNEVDLGPIVPGGHVADPAAVFYNTNDSGAIRPVHEAGYVTRLWGLETPGDFDVARNAGANVLGTDHVDPVEFEFADSTDPAQDIPSFTILDPIPTPVIVPDGPLA